MSLKAKPIKQDKQLWHPRYWLTWLFVSLLWLVSLLPYAAQASLSKLLGSLLAGLKSRRREIAKANIQLCFPDLTNAERQQLLKQHLQSLVLGLFETGISWWWSVKRFDKIIQIEGMEHLESLNGQGVLLLAFHFTHLDVGAGIVSRNISIDGVYKPHKNAVMEWLLDRGRTNKTQQVSQDNAGILYETKDLRGIIRALKKGRVIWYAPDQDFGRDRSIFVPFFGVQTATITATTGLAKAGKARVVPMLQRRLSNNKIEVKIFPPLEDFPGASEEDDTRRICEINEAFVREQPADYLWVHRRFKTRPEGESDPYEKMPR